MIATWNVNSLKVRLEIVQQWLKKHNPDFLLLQEIKGENEEIFDNFKSLGYNSYLHLQKTYNGVAILSKHTCKVVQINIPNFEDHQARLIAVEYNGFIIINVYMPNGGNILAEDNTNTNPKYLYKLDWQNAFSKYVQQLVQEGKKIIIGGDFNVIPKDEDCYNIKAFISDALAQPNVRDWYFNLLALGFTDILDFFNLKQESNFTWWDYRAGAFAKDNGARIDHILFSNNVLDNVKKCTIDKAPRLLKKPSDHTPIICHFSI